MSKNTAADLKAQMKAMMGAVKQDTTSKQQGGGSDFFKLTVDSDGNGSAVIRFLPQKDLSKLPYVETFSHYFQDEVTGKTYNELSASTFGERDVIGLFNGWLWKKGYEDRVKGQKRTQNFYANVLVVKNPKDPTAEGEVKVFRFGKKIFDKIEAAMFPDEELGEEAINVFDVFDGANFRLKAHQDGGFRSYNNSSFDGKLSAIADDEDDIMEILDKTHDLSAFADKSKLKSEEEQIKILDGVFGRDPLWAEFKEASGFESSAPVQREVEQAPAVQESTKAQPAKQEAKAESVPEINTEGMDEDVAAILSGL